MRFIEEDSRRCSDITRRIVRDDGEEKLTAAFDNQRAVHRDMFL